MNGVTFLMAGGGTGGHVMPAIAVADQLRRRGHRPIFVGTQAGLESRLVPQAGYEIEWIDIGGLKRVGLRQTLRTAWQLPASVVHSLRIMNRRRPSAIFSMGGYVAGPVVLAALLRNKPVVLMEPNAVPGLTNRRAGRFVARALVNFPEAARYFPEGKAEVTGVPVRPAFFEILPRPISTPFTLLITGGSRGSRTLNEAARQSWPLFAESKLALRILHQSGIEAHGQLAAEFQRFNLDGEVVPFIPDMPAAFARADLIVCRSGASAVSEVAAAGKPAIFVPFPFAADNHQWRNAESLARNQAARLVEDREMNGERLFRETLDLAAHPHALHTMGDRARSFAKPHAAQRAADILEQLATGGTPCTADPDVDRQHLT